MTYSRPAIGPTGGVSVSISKPGAQGLSQSVGPQLSKNGAELDYRSPEQAGQNELTKNAGFDSLMASLLKIGSVVGPAVNENRQRVGMGELLNNEGAKEILKQGGGEARGLLWTYDNSYKDQIVAPIAGEAALQARAKWQANIAADANLRDESWLLKATPEMLSEKYRSLEPEEVRTLANLSVLSPDGAKQGAVVYQQGKEEDKQKIRMRTVEARIKNNSVLVGKSMAVSIDAEMADFDARVASGVDIPAKRDWANASGERLGEVLASEGKRLNLSPTEVLTSGLRKADEELEQAIADVEEQSRLGETVDYTRIHRAEFQIGMIMAAAGSKALAPDGVSILEKEGSEGASVIAKLAGRRRQVGAIVEQIDKVVDSKSAARAQADLMLAAPGDEAARRQILAGVIAKANAQNKPELIVMALQAADQVDTREYQLDERARVAYEREASGDIARQKATGQPFSNEQIAAVIGAGGRGANQAEAMLDHNEKLGRIEEGKANDAERAEQAAWGQAKTAASVTPVLEGDVGVEAEKVVSATNAMFGDKKLREKIPGGTPENQMKFAASNINTRAQGIVLERIRQDIVDKGQAPDRKTIEQYNREALKQAGEDLAASLKKADPTAPAPRPENLVMQEEVETFLERTRKNRGVPKWEFLPARVKARQKSGPNLSEGLTMWGTMRDAMKGSDGKPMFGENNRNQIIQRLREVKDETPDNRQSFRIPAGLLGAGKQVASALNGLAGLGITPEDIGLEQTFASVAPKTETVTAVVAAPKDEKPGADPHPKATEKAAQLPLRLADVPISTAAGAGVKTLNADRENLERLGLLQQGKEPLTVATPPLPQAPPEAPSARIPLRAQDTMHPWVYSMLEARARRAKGGRQDDVAVPEHLWRRRSSGYGGIGEPNTAGFGSQAERPESVVYENSSGQPGLDVYFKTKAFPAVLPGRVKQVGFEPGYGNFVVVESTDPRNGRTVDVLYGHLGDARGGGVFVKEGQQVSSGSVLGRQGSTGNVRSADGTIASIDFLAPAPKGNGSMTPYADYDGLRRAVGKGLQQGRFIGEPVTGSMSARVRPDSKSRALAKAAQELGVDPLDLATIIAYETAGTFRPNKWGGTGGNYMGLIQFGGPERKMYGAHEGQSFEEQVTGPVVKFLKDRFSQVGMSTRGADITTLYRTINGGNPKASLGSHDGNGTIQQHVERMMGDHRRSAQKRFFL